MKYTHPCPDRLVAIVSTRDVNEVKAFIEREKCSGDAFDGFTHSALMKAAEQGNLEVVRALIAAGADVNFGLSSGGTAMYGITALWYAIKADHPEVVAELLHAGADPNLSPNTGLPLLVLAAMNETSSCAKLLIEAGVSKTATTSKGETAMTFSGGPSAEVFAYFESVGMDSSDLPAGVKASLRWEATHTPKLDASSEQKARFHAEIARTTKSTTARAFAIKHLKVSSPAIAVPALVEVAIGPSINELDWGPHDAIVALHELPWTTDEDKALETFFTMMAKDKRQQIRLQLMSLLGRRAPVSPKTVDALLARLDHGDDRANAAWALGDLLKRATNDDGALVRRTRKALERLARGPAGPDCDGPKACERVVTTRAAREALTALPR